MPTVKKFFTTQPSGYLRKNVITNVFTFDGINVKT